MSERTRFQSQIFLQLSRLARWCPGLAQRWNLYEARFGKKQVGPLAIRSACALKFAYALDSHLSQAAYDKCMGRISDFRFRPVADCNVSDNLCFRPKGTNLPSYKTKELSPVIYFAQLRKPEPPDRIRIAPTSFKTYSINL